MKNGLIFTILLQLVIARASMLAQTTAFTYQGRLQDGDEPANGSYDLRFTLAATPADGNYIGNPLTNAPVSVRNGLFTVALDFGGSVFDGSPRWLEIGVRRNGSSGPYTTLSPRQAITATPYAAFANTASNAAVAASLDARVTVNGSSIQAGTVNSNRLDSATAAQLALAGTGTATNLASGLSVTNITLYSSTARAATSRRFFSWHVHPSLTDRLMFDSGPSDEWTPFYMSLYSTNCSLFQAIWNPVHGPAYVVDGTTVYGNTAEMQLTSSGAIAVSTGYGATGTNVGWQERRIQMGIGGFGQPYLHFQYSSVPVYGGPTNLFPSSYPLFFQATCYTNVGQFVNAGSLDPLGKSLPAVFFQATSTNGSGAWVFYDRFNTKMDAITKMNWDFPNAVERMRITAGPDGGLSFRGKLIQEQSRMLTISGDTCPLDFGKGQLTQITNATTATTFYITNATGISTNYEQRVFIIHGGAGLSIGWPTNWNWVSDVTTNLAEGQLLRLQVESLGPRGWDVIAMASVGTSTSYRTKEDHK